MPQKHAPGIVIVDTTGTQADALAEPVACVVQGIVVNERLSANVVIDVVVVVLRLVVVSVTVLVSVGVEVHTVAIFSGLQLPIKIAEILWTEVVALAPMWIRRQSTTLRDPECAKVDMEDGGRR